MRIILLKDVGGVGRCGDVKDIADGFARNQLIPRGLAEIATPKALAAALSRKARKEDAKRLESSLLAKNTELVNGKVFQIARKANADGHLFAKIRPKDIVELIEKESRVVLPEDAIVSPEYVDRVGEHAVSLRTGGKSGQCVLRVVVE